MEDRDEDKVICSDEGVSASVLLGTGAGVSVDSTRLDFSIESESVMGTVEDSGSFGSVSGGVEDDSSGTKSFGGSSLETGSACTSAFLSIYGIVIVFELEYQVWTELQTVWGFKHTTVASWSRNTSILGWYSATKGLRGIIYSSLLPKDVPLATVCSTLDTKSKSLCISGNGWTIYRYPIIDISNYKSRDNGKIRRRKPYFQVIRIFEEQWWQGKCIGETQNLQSQQKLFVECLEETFSLLLSLNARTCSWKDYMEC